MNTQKELDQLNQSVQGIKIEYGLLREGLARVVAGLGLNLVYLNLTLNGQIKDMSAAEIMRTIEIIYEIRNPE